MAKKQHNIPKGYKKRLQHKTEAETPTIVVGDLTEPTTPATPTAPPQYLGGTEKHLLTKRRKIVVFVLLGVLVLASAGWLILNKETTLTEEQKLSKFYKDVAVDVAKDKNIKLPSGNLSDSYEAPDFETAIQIGDSYAASGDYKRAAQAYLAAEKLAQSENYVLFQSIGNMYAKLFEIEKAKDYYERALVAIKKLNDKDEAMAAEAQINEALAGLQ